VALALGGAGLAGSALGLRRELQVVRAQRTCGSGCSPFTCAAGKHDAKTPATAATDRLRQVPVEALAAGVVPLAHGAASSVRVGSRIIRSCGSEHRLS